MAFPFPNLYHKRLVAPHASKPCFICFKPTSTVLNQAENRDWFFVCAGHLSDRGFAIAQVDEEAEKAKKRKEELDQEIEVVKAEFEAKQKAKGKKKKEKEEKKGGKKIKDDDAPVPEEEEEDHGDKKLMELEAKKADATAASGTQGPRIFELNKSVYQMRVTKLRNAVQARQAQERAKTTSVPGFFPSVPRGGV